MKGTVAIIGANQTGLFTAKLFSEQGFSVFVFEKNSRESSAYEWTDDIAPSVFKEVGLDFPPKEIFTRTRNLTFVPPDKKNPFSLSQPENEREITVDRRALNEWLLSLLPNSAEVYYDATVTRVLMDGENVVGVELENGETLATDLVIDCGGVNSSVRQTLPRELKIEHFALDADKFFVRRALFKRSADCPLPNHPKKIYLKHKNEQGMSWCFLKSDDQTADVLVGRIGELSDETYERALDDLKKDNPVIGEKISCDDRTFEIPVRRPLSRIVANGYALLGDSACMTMPLSGSGIASSMRASKMLLDAVLTAGKEYPFSIKILYRYQLKFMREIGGMHSAVEYVKNKLLSSDKNEINDLIASGVMEGLVLAVSGAGTKKLMSAFLKLPFKHFSLFRALSRALIKSTIIVSHATKMPPRFDEATFDKWCKKYDKPFKR